MEFRWFGQHLGDRKIEKYAVWHIYASTTRGMATFFGRDSKRSKNCVNLAGTSGGSTTKTNLTMNICIILNGNANQVINVMIFTSFSMTIWHIFGMRHCLCAWEFGTSGMGAHLLNLFIKTGTYPVVRPHIGWRYKSLCVRCDHPQAQSAPQCQWNTHGSLGNSGYSICSAIVIISPISLIRCRCTTFR